MKIIEGYDVIVVGGGAGGAAAAICASRGGAKTLLLEREGCLGGAATTMLVHPFMSHETSTGPEGEPPRVVNAGVFREVTDRLVAMGAGRDERCVKFDDEAMKLVLDELASDAGVEVVFHAALFDVEAEAGRIRSARFAHNSGALRVAGQVFIDATGDSLPAAAAGCECAFGDASGEVMPMTLNFLVGGVDTDSVPFGRLKELTAAGDSDAPPLVNTHLSCVSVPRAGFVHFNAVRIPGNTLEARTLSFAEAEGRRRANNYVAWLRANVPGFENSFLAKTGSHVGIRESRRVIGDYVLTGDDFRRAAKFDDGIACCSYMVDIHHQAPNRTTLAHLPPGEHYQIPYRCLTPKGTENLLIASRGISADVEANSSLRIMPVVMCIGQAAGLAAAMSLPEGDVRGIDVQALRASIRDSGGILEPK